MNHVLLKWFSDLLVSSTGRINLSNMIFDVHFERVQPGKLRDFLSQIGSWLSTATAVKDPIESIKLVADRKPEEFVCQGPPLTPERVSRIVAAVPLVSHHIDSPYSPIAITGAIADAVVDELILHGIDGKTKGPVSGSRPFAWVTKTSTIEELRAKIAPDRLANEVRDAAGLAHFYRTERLLELQYPIDSPAVDNLKAPTFVEGGGSDIFRCCVRPDGWGAAVWLGSLNDGLPEAVHPPVPWTGHFVLLNIGHLDGTYPTHHPDAFEKRLLYPWTPDSIAELEAYVA